MTKQEFIIKVNNWSKNISNCLNRIIYKHMLENTIYLYMMFIWHALDMHADYLTMGVLCGSFALLCFASVYKDKFLHLIEKGIDIEGKILDKKQNNVA